MNKHFIVFEYFFYTIPSIIFIQFKLFLHVYWFECFKLLDIATMECEY